MEDKAAGIRTAERLAGLIAMIAALVVLNGAWVNQHNWQNVSWRVAVAATLVLLAIAVETNVFGRLRQRERWERATVPDFMRAPSEEAATPAADEPTHADAVGTRERG